MKHYYDVAFKTSGGVAVPAPNVSVSVFLTGTFSLATIFSDDGITTKGNPLTTDAFGKFDFYIADGRYDISFSGVGILPFTQSNVEVSDVTEKQGGDANWNVGTIGATLLNATTINTSTLAASSSISGASVTVTGLTVGNCVQVTTGGLLTTAGAACGTSSGTLTPTGSPASGNLAKWSGGTSLTNADLTGDVTTSGTVATTMAASIAGAKTFTTSLTSPFFSSSTANAAASGVLRLASSDLIGWRNNANNGDIQISKNSADTLIVSSFGALQFPQVVRPSADSTASLVWQNFAATQNVLIADTTNFRIGINSNGVPAFTLDVFGGTTRSGVFLSNTANAAATGALRLGNADLIAWRNAGNTNNVALGLTGAAGNVPADTLSANQGGTSSGFMAAFFGSLATTTNISAVGAVRLGNGDNVAWRNNANNGDVGFALNGAGAGNVPADTLTLAVPGGALRGLWATPVIASSSNTAASSGSIRLANTDSIFWRNNANNADIGLQKFNNDTWTLSGGSINLSGALAPFYGQAFSASNATTGLFRLNSVDTINWRNNANSADITGISKNTSDQFTIGGAGLLVASFVAGTSGQCINTSGSAVVWGSCAGTAGVQTLTSDGTTTTVNAAVTSNQNLKSYSVVASTLNAVPKTIRVRGQGQFIPVNTTETVTVNSTWGSGAPFALQISIVPAGTGAGNWLSEWLCVTTATGSSGTSSCSGQITIADSTGVTKTVLLESSITNNLTIALPLQYAISFSTASTTNQGFQSLLVVEQMN